jgi:hypothetical protein
LLSNKNYKKKEKENANLLGFIIHMKKKKKKKPPRNGVWLSGSAEQIISKSGANKMLVINAINLWHPMTPVLITTHLSRPFNNIITCNLYYCCFLSLPLKLLR